MNSAQQPATDQVMQGPTVTIPVAEFNQMKKELEELRARIAAGRRSSSSATLQEQPTPRVRQVSQSNPQAQAQQTLQPPTQPQRQPQTSPRPTQQQRPPSQQTSSSQRHTQGPHQRPSQGLSQRLAQQSALSPQNQNQNQIQAKPQPRAQPQPRQQSQPQPAPLDPTAAASAPTQLSVQQQLQNAAAAQHVSVPQFSYNQHTATQPYVMNRGQESQVATMQSSGTGRFCSSGPGMLMGSWANNGLIQVSRPHKITIAQTRGTGSAIFQTMDMGKHRSRISGLRSGTRRLLLSCALRCADEA